MNFDQKAVKFLANFHIYGGKHWTHGPLRQMTLLPSLYLPGDGRAGQQRGLAIGLGQQRLSTTLAGGPVLLCCCQPWSWSWWPPGVRGGPQGCRSFQQAPGCTWASSLSPHPPAPGPRRSRVRKGSCYPSPSSFRRQAGAAGAPPGGPRPRACFLPVLERRSPVGTDMDVPGPARYQGPDASIRSSFPHPYFSISRKHPPHGLCPSPRPHPPREWDPSHQPPWCDTVLHCRGRRPQGLADHVVPERKPLHPES